MCFFFTTQVPFLVMHESTNGVYLCRLMSFVNRIFSVFKLNPNYAERVFGLDLMRAVAILAVVISHGSMLEKANTNFPWIPIPDGVELFFVLSGFLIGQILIRQVMDKPKFGWKEIKAFWIRRWFRTLPLYYLILLCNLAVVSLGIIHEDIGMFSWKFFFFLQNFVEPFYGFFWESWSLSVEEWFYLLFPLTIALLLALVLPFGWKKPHAILISIVLFLVVPFALRLATASQLEVDQFWLEVKVYKIVVLRLDAIAFGLLAAYWQRFHQSSWEKWKVLSFVLGLLLIFGLMQFTWEPNAFQTKVLKVVYRGLGCMLLLPLLSGWRTAPKWPLRIFTHISLISYSMYLINLALVSEVIRDNFPPQTAQEAWVMYAVYWTVTIVVSTLLFKYFETPFLKLRNRLFSA